MIPARRSAAALRFFDWYVARYLRQRWSRVRLWGAPEHIDIPAGWPLVCVMSHASWWDVLIGYYLARHVIRIESYAPMDEAQLRRYRILNRIGIYSVDRFSAQGLREFLQYTEGLLRAGHAVWVTPQGEITSNWKRPVRFQTGIGHLLRRVPRVVTVPIAIAYEFLEEPRPEVFVKIGPARRWERPREAAAKLTRILERDLERELDALQAALTERDTGPFSMLLEGVTSVSRVYDAVRTVRAWLSGRPDPRRHGDLVSDPRKIGSQRRSDR